VATLWKVQRVEGFNPLIRGVVVFCSAFTKDFLIWENPFEIVQLLLSVPEKNSVVAKLCLTPTRFEVSVDIIQVHSFMF
jgi:hypothetical protein